MLGPWLDWTAHLAMNDFMQRWETQYWLRPRPWCFFLWGLKEMCLESHKALVVCDGHSDRHHLDSLCINAHESSHRNNSLSKGKNNHYKCCSHEYDNTVCITQEQRHKTQDCIPGDIQIIAGYDIIFPYSWSFKAIKENLNCKDRICDLIFPDLKRKLAKRVPNTIQVNERLHMSTKNEYNTDERHMIRPQTRKFHSKNTSRLAQWHLICRKCTINISNPLYGTKDVDLG